MKPVMSLLFLLQIIINGDLLGVVRCAADGLIQCRNSGNLTSEMGYPKLKAISNALSSLPGNVTKNRAYVSTTAGENTDAQVTSVALCYGNIGRRACRRCVSNSINQVRRACPLSPEAVAWDSNCMVRYSDRKILGVLDSWTSVNQSTEVFVPDVDAFEKALEKMTARLQAEAAGGNSSLKLAVGSATYGESSSRIYAMMQCTPDLSREQCSECLKNTITQINNCCTGKVGARVFFPNCFLRYSYKKFYNDATSTPSPSSEGKKDEKSNTTKMIYS